MEWWSGGVVEWWSGGALKDRKVLLVAPGSWLLNSEF